MGVERNASLGIDVATRGSQRIDDSFEVPAEGTEAEIRVLSGPKPLCCLGAELANVLLFAHATRRRTSRKGRSL
jgi:hypothetical protein